MTTIKVYNQVLERLGDELSAERGRQVVTKMGHYIERLNDLISDLLDVSKINAGKLDMEISEFELSELVLHSVESAQLLSHRHTIVCDNLVKVKLKGDFERLEQVMVNLLSNAMKYSPEHHEVIIKTKKVGQQQIKVSVIDQGIGIDPAEQARIFERFFRSEHSAQTISGLGIGLYISSAIIKRHHGNIYVKSEPGKGSTFSFTLPIYDPEKKTKRRRAGTHAKKSAAV